MTAPGPMASALPDLAVLAAVPHPVDRARLVGEVARRFGTLPGPFAKLRAAALTEARADGRTATWIAERVGLTPSRVSRLIKLAAGQEPTP